MEMFLWSWQNIFDWLSYFPPSSTPLCGSSNASPNIFQSTLEDTFLHLGVKASVLWLLIPQRRDSAFSAHCSNGEPGLFQWIRSGARAAFDIVWSCSSCRACDPWHWTRSDPLWPASASLVRHESGRTPSLSALSKYALCHHNVGKCLFHVLVVGGMVGPCPCCNGRLSRAWREGGCSI